MDKKTATSEWLTGRMLLVAEYRSSAAEVIQYRDKQTGKAATLKTLTHQVELGNTSVQVRERVDDNFDTAGFKAPFKKGTMVIFRVESLTRDKGVFKGAGVLEPLSE